MNPDMLDTLTDILEIACVTGDRISMPTRLDMIAEIARGAIERERRQSSEVAAWAAIEAKS